MFIELLFLVSIPRLCNLLDLLSLSYHLCVPSSLPRLPRFSPSLWEDALLQNGKGLPDYLDTRLRQAEEGCFVMSQEGYVENLGLVLWIIFVAVFSPHLNQK